LLCAVGAIAFGIYSAHRGTQPQFKNDWTVTVITAGIAFGYVLRNPSLKHNAKFWRTWCLLLLAHFAVFLSLFSRMEKVPLIWGAAIAPVELMALTFAINWIEARRIDVKRFLF